MILCCCSCVWSTSSSTLSWSYWTDWWFSYPMESYKRSESSVPGTSMALIDIICFTIPQDNCGCRLLQCQSRHQFFILFSELAPVIFHPTFHHMFVYLPATLFSSILRKLFIFCHMFAIHAAEKILFLRKLFNFLFLLIGKNSLCFARLVSGAIGTMDTHDNSKGLFCDFVS